MTADVPSAAPEALDVLVVGSVNVDVFAAVTQLPGPGETVMAPRSVPDALGGKGANQACAAAALGARTALVGAVGRDQRGRWLTEAIGGRGVDVSLLRGSDEPSGWAHILVDPTGENMIIVDPGANADIDPDHVAAAFARFQPAVVLVQLEIPLTAALAALRAGKACGALTLCNASPVDEQFRPEPGLVDCLIVNRSEAERFSGEADPGRATRRLSGRTGGTVLTTLGRHGVVLAAADGAVTERAAVPPARVVDTTGAGDVFAGALAAGLVTADLSRAVDLAQRAASWSVSRAGIATPALADLGGNGG